jgi:hypothetical protein
MRRGSSESCGAQFGFDTCAEVETESSDMQVLLTTQATISQKEKPHARTWDTSPQDLLSASRLSHSPATRAGPGLSATAWPMAPRVQ